MTEAELIDGIIGYNSTVPAWLALYVTVLSGYLIVAYLVGKDLTRSQMTIVSGCFALFTTLCSYAALGNSKRILEFTNELRALNPDRQFAMNEIVLYSVAFMLFTGIFVGLKFMWDVRHSKE